MCGIAGIFAYGASAPPIDQEELLRIREAMIRRGPDGAGLWISPDQRAGLAHRRLAIIDLSETGAQPMATADGRFRITFNGEIYNYRELRAQLQAKGCVFRSNSDTEVLLHLYAERGAEMVHALRGMFAFGIHDSFDQTIFLARDPFGIKPLYYADDGSSFRFASQVKALLKGGRVDTSPAPAGQVGFYLWGHLPDPYTLYKGITSLPPGSTMLVDAGGRREPKKYFSIAREFASANALAADLSPQASREKLHAALKDSVRHHLVADVPVGVFLSSGLDSTTLTALAAEAGSGDLHTITLGFDEYRGTGDDETPLASLVARTYGTSHRTQWVSRNDFAAHMDAMLEAMDQPSIDGVNTYFVSRAAAEAGMKVALSGVGGDELFGGYPSFRELPLMAGSLGVMQRFPRVGRGFRRVSAPLLKHFTSPKYAGLLEYGGSYAGGYLLRRGLYMPWELPEFLDGDLVRQGWDELQTLLRLEETVRGVDSDFQKVSALELSWYMRNQLLRDSDWAGMAHSLEIRVPLVDVELFRHLAPLTARGRASKQEMARAPARPLPQQVTERRKTGFSIPVRDWLRQAGSGSSVPRGIRGWARRILPPPKKPKRVLALVTDAFGGHGGIANFNRDFLSALCAHEAVGELVVFVRHAPGRYEGLPRKLTYVTSAAGSKIRFAATVLKYAIARPRTDLVVCGHINLLPLGFLLRSWFGVPILLEIYGIDAWQRTSGTLANFYARRVDAVVSISEITKQRFMAWSGCEDWKFVLLPNAIHAGLYGVGPKDPAMLKRYGLDGRVVLMTLGRIVSQERYKGFDEVLELLPTLCLDIPNVAYLIVGDGTDRRRLEEKAISLGVSDRVVFAGLIDEAEKADHYRLADAYVMPSCGEGFGFVFLEAMACGIPVIGSLADGSREALMNGSLGTLVDPDDAGGIKRAILAAIPQPREIPKGLEYFSYANFERRVRHIVDRW